MQHNKSMHSAHEIYQLSIETGPLLHAKFGPYWQHYNQAYLVIAVFVVRVALKNADNAENDN